MNRPRFFITHLLPRHLIARHGLSFAACNFSYNLISGKGFDRVFSLMPLFVGGSLNNSAFDDACFTLVYLQSLRRMGWLGRNLASLCEQWLVFRQIPSAASVWFYNLTIHNAFLFLLLKFFRRQTQLHFIVLDLTPPFRLFSKNRLFLKWINGAHGRICLSQSELFRSDNAVVLPGAVAKDAVGMPRLINKNRRFLLCGVMNETISQTAMVLRSFARLPQYELHITGHPDNESLVVSYAERYPNIIYHGVLTYQDYLHLLHKVTFVLSTRNPACAENLCNFPSKIIEALLHNRAVVSTMNYKQLHGIRYMTVSSEENDFQKEIMQIGKMDDQQLECFTNQGDRIYEMCNADIWNDTMRRIESL